ncbi:hypothetical protein POM88_045907 [Heracleum sosnowskyi]|uniref:Uncharacterized protein n=1 Tax=Heracleum sosnowskyi TaxID=360622 RepID=A0AAD8H7E3_9APIA|nr:hypothetical protein POM88_045907 [Heracleum sosnowskyi]
MLKIARLGFRSSMIRRASVSGGYSSLPPDKSSLISKIPSTVSTGFSPFPPAKSLSPAPISFIRRFATSVSGGFSLLPPDKSSPISIIASPVSSGFSQFPPAKSLSPAPIAFIRRYATSVSGGYSPLPPDKSLMIINSSTSPASLIPCQKNDNEILLEEDSEQILRHFRYLELTCKKMEFFLKKQRQLQKFERPVLPDGYDHFTPLSATIPSEGYLILQLMMNVCRGDQLLNGKGLWTGYVVDNHVISIRRYKKNKKESAKARISADNEVKNLSTKDKTLFETVWRNVHNKQHKDFWIRQAVLHSYFSSTDCIKDYIYKAGHLFLKFLGGGSHDIPTILKDLGYQPGHFYEAVEIMEKVSKRLGVVVYPIFKLEDQIPCLDYFAVATDLKGIPVTHPTACLLSGGMVLFPRL